MAVPTTAKSFTSDPRTYPVVGSHTADDPKNNDDDQQKYPELTRRLRELGTDFRTSKIKPIEAMRKLNELRKEYKDKLQLSAGFARHQQRIASRNRNAAAQRFGGMENAGTQSGCRHQRRPRP